jgi:peptide-methionine (S)-S-oxide reductase
MKPILRVVMAAGLGLLADQGAQCYRHDQIKERMMEDRKTAQKLEKATFAAGCFWGVEDVFRGLKGVTATQVGYSGGSHPKPSYQDVCTGATGHAEAVEVEFDPARISYDELLDVFWKSHDPTSKNRQGPDVGTQYRSAIFYHTDEQLRAARASKERLEKSGRFKRPIATEIAPAAEFHRAEEYHQQYHQKHGGSCRIL